MRLLPHSAAFAALFGLGLAGLPAAAGPIPDVEMTIVDGGLFDPGSGTWLAGVRMRLDDGWKTYWRSPGELGIPPSFDFSDSRNVADVEVRWPAPSVTHDGFGWVVGYEDEVILPLVVTPRDSALPVSLSLELDYAICRDICVPMDGRAERALDEGGPDRPAIEHHLARVPADDSRIARLERVRTDDGAAVEFAVALSGTEAGDAGDPPRLLVEFETAGTERHLAVLEMAERDGADMATYRLPADRLPAREQAGTSITVTGLTRPTPFEQRLRLP